MKNLVYLFILLPALLFAQDEANFLSSWDDVTIPGSAAYDNRYNEVWGIVANDREIAVIGSTLGTHFIDVTDPTSPVELDFESGKASGTNIIHRDFKDYGCYLYAVADEGVSSLQIFDYSDMPNSLSLVYDSGDLITQAHNLFIDKENAVMYAVATSSPTQNYPLRTFSLADPANPVLLGEWGSGIVGHVHDLYIRDEIGYLNCGNSGFYIVDFTDPANPVTLGSMTTYQQQGYNHSGWLSDDGNYYYLGDENLGLDIKVVDVSDFTDIRVVGTVNSGGSNSITHNQLVRGDFLYTSYYFDGLQVFDISNPAAPVRVAYYDTTPQEPQTHPYIGAWGVYPLLPSGNILLSDMQLGLVVVEKWDNTISGILPELGTEGNCGIPLGIKDQAPIQSIKNIFPQPANEQLNLTLELTKQSQAQVVLVDLTGRVLKNWDYSLVNGQNNLALNVENIPTGMYLLRVLGDDFEMVGKTLIGR